MRTLLSILLIICAVKISSCKKIIGCEGSTSESPPISPYQNPIWHPSGNLLGFSHQVLQSVVIDKSDCMTYYACTFYPDSLGFWLVNKDGTNMRRETTFQLYYPAWSPDGSWIAFCNGGVIYKMTFDGTSFDTSHIVPLTDNVYKHFFPTWSPHSDTIFYDTNIDSPEGTIFYDIWKMAADGSGQTRVTDSALSITNGDRQPVCIPDGHVLYNEYPKGTQQEQLFEMDADGNNKGQITHFSENFGTIDQYTYFNNQVYFEFNGIWRINMDGSGMDKVTNNSFDGFSIAKDGTIGYVNRTGDIEAVINKTHGTIWTMDSNGNNAKPLTYNIY